MQTEVLKLSARRYLVGQHRLGGLGKQDLARMAGCQQPFATVQRRTKVVAFSELCLSGMWGHPHLQLQTLRPGLAGKSLLDLERACRRGRSCPEHRQDARRKSGPQLALERRG